MEATAGSGQRAAVIVRLRAAGCVFAEDEAALLIADAASPDDLDDLVAARCGGLPLEHLLGWAEFCGLRVLVDPGVFVPRRRTELLVREALAVCGTGSTVIELCCGSAAVGVALAVEVGQLDLHATDIDAVAVRCARRNLLHAGEVYLGDLFEPLPASLRGRADAIVANAPYVPSDAIAFMPPEARDHEPRVALDGGTDGTAVHEQIAAQAPAWLAPGGHLLIETGSEQAARTRAHLDAAGLITQVVRDEDLDATVVIGRRPA